MSIIATIAARQFGKMSLEEKRSMVSKALSRHVPSPEQSPTGGVFSAARSRVLEAFGLDKPLSRGTGHYLYDGKGREYLDFSSTQKALPAEQNQSTPRDDHSLTGRLEDLHAAYPSVIKAVDGAGMIVDVEFHPFNGDDASGTMAYCSLNDYLGPLFSSYLFNIQRIVTAPVADRSHLVRLHCPANASRSEIDRAADAIATLCDALDRGDYYQVVHHLVGKAPTAQGAKRRYATPARRSSHMVAHATEGRPRGKFAFLLHYTTEEEYVRSDPSFEQFTAEEFQQWREWSKAMGPGVVHHIDPIGSPAGGRAEGRIIALPMLPRDMLALGRRKTLPILRDALQLAKDRGSSVLGLGGFTSILSDGGQGLTGNGMAITSGNTLTTVMAVGGIEQVACRAGLDLTRAHTAVVGATGAIGRLAALMLARRVGSLTLVGNPSNPNALQHCRRITGEIYGTLLQENEREHDPGSDGDFARRLRETVIETVDDRDSEPDDEAYHVQLGNSVEEMFRSSGQQPPIHRSADPETALLDADLVVIATNSDTAIVRPEQLKEGAIVCDVARPPNVPDDIINGRNVLVFDGGLVELPQPVSLGPIQGLPPGVCWGCLGETILLALAGETADYSIGPRLTLAAADQLAELAKKHGFRPAPPQWYGRGLTDADYRRIRPHLPAQLHGELASERPQAWKAA